MRKSGRTTRLVDKAIQNFFNSLENPALGGEGGFIAHIVDDDAEQAANIAVARIKAEHGIEAEVRVLDASTALIEASAEPIAWEKPTGEEYASGASAEPIEEEGTSEASAEPIEEEGTSEASAEPIEEEGTSEDDDILKEIADDGEPEWIDIIGDFIIADDIHVVEEKVVVPKQKNGKKKLPKF